MTVSYLWSFNWNVFFFHLNWDWIVFLLKWEYLYASFSMGSSIWRLHRSWYLNCTCSHHFCIIDVDVCVEYKLARKYLCFQCYFDYVCNALGDMVVDVRLSCFWMSGLWLFFHFKISTRKYHFISLNIIS